MFIRLNSSNGTPKVRSRFVSVGSQLSTRLLVDAIYLAANHAKGKILDVGCGDQPYRKMFSKCDYTGVDWPNTEHPVKPKAYCSADALPFKPNSFDTLICTEVIEHLQTPENAIQGFSRVLKPGGTLILSAPFYHWLHEAPYDYFRFTEFGLSTLLKKSGFNIQNRFVRGGASTVVVDVSGRTAGTILNFILKKCRIPMNYHRFISMVFIGYPQIVYYHLRRILGKMSYKGLKILDPDQRISLGFVFTASNQNERPSSFPS